MPHDCCGTVSQASSGGRGLRSHRRATISGKYFTCKWKSQVGIPQYIPVPSFTRDPDTRVLLGEKKKDDGEPRKGLLCVSGARNDPLGFKSTRGQRGGAQDFPCGFRLTGVASVLHIGDHTFHIFDTICVFSPGAASAPIIEPRARLRVTVHCGSLLVISALNVRHFCQMFNGPAGPDCRGHRATHAHTERARRDIFSLSINHAYPTRRQWWRSG